MKEWYECNQEKPKRSGVYYGQTKNDDYYVRILDYDVDEDRWTEFPFEKKEIDIVRWAYHESML